MSWGTEWFVADPSEAEAIASIVTEERVSDDWPNLYVQRFGLMEQSALWAAIRGDLNDRPSTVGAMLHERDDVLVFVVAAEFVAALAALAPAEHERVAADWQRCEELQGWDPIDVRRVLDELVGFAGRAITDGKSVIELALIT